MKIVHAVNEVADTGNGISNVAVDLAIAQRRAGHTVIVASSGGGFESLLASEGVETARVPLGRGARHSVAALARFRDLVRRVGPDVVHAHTVAPSVLAGAVRRSPGVPRFALVATVHNVYQRSSRLMALADITVGVAPQVAETMREWSPAPRSTTFVTNAVVGSPRREHDDVRSLDLGPRSLVAIGAVSHRKGVDVLEKAFRLLAAEFPELSLWFVGNRDWADFVESAEGSALGARIHFTGFDSRPADYARAADVVVVASRREGLALSLLEARECGAAIVATDSDGALEGLDGGRAGLVVPSDDPDALADALREVLRDDALAADLRARSAADLHRFSVGRMSNDYLALYERASA